MERFDQYYLKGLTSLSRVGLGALLVGATILALLFYINSAEWTGLAYVGATLLLFGATFGFLYPVIFKIPVMSMRFVWYKAIVGIVWTVDIKTASSCGTFLPP